MKYPFLYSLHFNDLKSNTNGSFQGMVDKEINFETVRALAKKFVQEINLNSEAPVVVGHIIRTKECLLNMAELVPEFAEDLKNLSKRLVDLQKVFKDHIYYHPCFKGSYYLKNIIPKICSEISYEHIEIKSGIHAQYEFKRLREQPIKEQNRIRQNLKMYGEMDALSLLKTYQFLESKSRS